MSFASATKHIRIVYSTVVLINQFFCSARDDFGLRIVTLKCHIMNICGCDNLWKPSTPISLHLGLRIIFDLVLELVDMHVRHARVYEKNSYAMKEC
jgi:hypothetical protein